MDKQGEIIKLLTEIKEMLSIKREVNVINLCQHIWEYPAYNFSGTSTPYRKCIKCGQTEYIRYFNY